MRIRRFGYLAPAGLEEALEALKKSGPESKVLAGGTDLLPALKHGDLRPGTIISLGRLKELDYIRLEDSRIRVGALTRLHDIATHPLVAEKLPSLSQAAGLIGSWQIRNVATLGGNLANGSPAADSAGPLLALDAEAVLAGPEGERKVPLSRFFKGPGATVLAKDQLLKEIVIPLPGGLSSGCYLKLMRKKSVDLALVGAAVQLEADEKSGRLTRAAIALGGVGPTPLRAGPAEQGLQGLKVEEALGAVPKISALAVESARPISDVRASAPYRRAMVEVFVRRGLVQTLESLSAKGGGS